MLTVSLVICLAWLVYLFFDQRRQDDKAYRNGMIVLTGVWVLSLAISCAAMLSVCRSPDPMTPGGSVGLTQEINFNIVTCTFAGIAILVGPLGFFDEIPTRKYLEKANIRNGVSWLVVLTAVIVLAAIPSPFAGTVPVTAQRERFCSTCLSASATLGEVTTADRIALQPVTDTYALSTKAVSLEPSVCLKTVNQMVVPDSDPVKWNVFGSKSCAWRAPANHTTGWVQVDLLTPKRIVMVSLAGLPGRRIRTCVPGGKDRGDDCTDSEASSTQDLEISASASNATGPFTTLAKGTLVANEAPAVQDIYIPAVDKYRYLRVRLSAQQNGTAAEIATPPNVATNCTIDTEAWRAALNEFPELCMYGWGVHLQSLDVFTGAGDRADAEL
jgi:hypothetical protein